jgi:predicted aldo/keto reductase-like oxidoreductase
MVEKSDPPGLGRREFIRGTAVVGLGGLGALALGSQRLARASDLPQIRRYRRLGRTGLEISDVSFGSSRSADPELPRYAFDRGVNYFDSAESYKGGRSEEAIGKSLSEVRDRVILTSKTKCRAETRASQLMENLEGSLRRLRTDRVDVYFNHAVNDLSRLKNDEWSEFATRARKQGKLRFTGFSGHGGNLVECIGYALDNDLIDVILCAYNFGQDPSFLRRLGRNFDFVAVQPGLPVVLQRARARGVGVVAMKTLRGARLNDMRRYETAGTTFAQAAFRWVLSSSNVDALVISMTSREEVDEFVAASGPVPPGSVELGLLERHIVTDAEGSCVQGCGVCQPSCPSAVPIAEVLRTRMYATGYRDMSFARDEYRALALNAEACATCSGEPCRDRCPQGLDIAKLTHSTHRMLD